MAPKPFFLCFLLVFPWPALGQEAPKIALSLEGAVQLGLQKAQDIKIAESQSRESKTSVDAAIGSILPAVNAQFDYTRSLTIIPLPAAFNIPGLPFGQANTHTFGLAFSQPVYRAGSVRGIEIAQDYFRSAKDQETETRLDTVLNICETYYRAVLAERLSEIAQLQIDQLEAQLKDVRLQRQAGNASDLDVSRVEVNRENVAPQLADALNARDDAMQSLKRLLNLAVSTDLSLIDELNAEKFSPIGDEDIRELSQTAVQQRAAVRAAERLNRIRQAEIKQAKAAFLPTVDIVGNIGEQAYPKDFIPRSPDFQDNWTAGFRVSIPIFAGGQRIARVKAARERLQQSEFQLEKLLLFIRSDVENWRVRLKRAEDLIGSRTRASKQAVRVYELTELSYRQGTGTHLDLTDARTNLRVARANEVQALHDYYTAYLRLIRTVGVPPENFAQVQTLSSHKLPPNQANPPNPEKKK